MKVRIENVGDTLNYGNCIRAVNAINKFKEKEEDLEIYVDVNSIEDLNRLKMELQMNNIYSLNLRDKESLFNRATNKLRKNNTSKGVSSIVFLGGDIFTETYGIDKLENELKKIQLMSQEKNVILIGPVIGPFTEGRGEIVKRALRDVHIYTRDDSSLNELRELGLVNLKRGRDLSLANMPNTNSINILEKYNLKDTKYISIVPSGEYNLFTESLKNYLKEYINIIQEILNNKILSEYKIVLMPHVISPEDKDDRVIIKKIYNALEDRYLDKVIMINEEMLPSEARVILGKGAFTISGRMDATLSTLFMRKPSISLSYDERRFKVITGDLGLKELTIDANKNSLWKTGTISYEVRNRVHYILRNYEELRKRINREVIIANKILDYQLEDFERVARVYKEQQNIQSTPGLEMSSIYR